MIKSSEAGHGIELPSYTLERIAKGDAVLFLGAGASLAATNKQGHPALKSTQLRDALCDEFLGGKAKDRSLANVGDLVKSTAGILEMQRFIAAKFEPLLPSQAHLSIPSFRWKAIVTTNYDLTVEKAYAASVEPLQKLRPILSDDDEIGPVLANPEKYVPLLKLHGCVTRANDQQLPMILSSWEYSRFRDRRARLFNYLKDWGYEYPIIFCGYSIADENIRDILFELSDTKISHPRYALITPSVIEVDKGMWAERKIDAVSATFAEFTDYLNERIPKANRLLGHLFKGASGALSKFIPGHETPSPDLAAYLEKQLVLVHVGMPTDAVRPVDFYHGVSHGWGWLFGEFDVRRMLLDELILSSVIEMDGAVNAPQLHLVLGYAGSGKSVALKRFAWEVSSVYSKPIFYLESGAVLDWGMLVEMHSLVRDTIFVVIDDAIAHLAQIADALKTAKRVGLPLVIVAGARTNEWNVGGAELVPHVSQTYELLDLSDKAVRELVAKLRDHGCLGYMKDFGNDEAFKYLKGKLNNQLLVALHEATSGRSFESIVEGEYLNVVPTEAQKLYLDICTVHRVGVPVRAGTISRISGIRLEDFKEKLFKPLEHVVQATFNPAVGDYAYRARHPKIAEIVFDSAVRDESSRSEQLVRIISSMNTGYSTDDEAITKLIRSKVLAKEFSDKELAYAIFRAARVAGVNEEAVDQHLAQFEALHQKGDLRRALHLIDEAINEARNGRPAKSTLHVKAMILRRLANEGAVSGLERDKRRQEARAILDRLMSDKRDPHPFIAKTNLLLDDLEERLDVDAPQGDRVVTDLIRDIQSTLAALRQLFAKDAYIATAEARFATVMEQHPRATAILEQAHKVDPTTSFLAIRLAEKYKKQGRHEEALGVLAKTLKVGGPNKDVHLAMAESLLELGERDNAQEISNHLRRSFSDGDSRYRSRYLFARHEFLYGDRDRANSEFSILGKERIPPRVINQARDPLRDSDGGIVRYSGEVLGQPRETFAFVRCNEIGADIFVHRNDVKSNWDEVSKGTRLTFSVHFTFRGPVAADVEIA